MQNQSKHNVTFDTQLKAALTEHEGNCDPVKLTFNL